MTLRSRINRLSERLVSCMPAPMTNSEPSGSRISLGLTQISLAAHWLITAMGLPSSISSLSSACQPKLWLLIADSVGGDQEREAES